MREGLVNPAKKAVIFQSEAAAFRLQPAHIILRAG